MFLGNKKTGCVAKTCEYLRPIKFLDPFLVSRFIVIFHFLGQPDLFVLTTMNEW